MQIRGGAALPFFDADRPYVRVGIRDELKTLGIGEATPWPAESSSSIEQMARALGEAFSNLGRVDLDELPPLEAVVRALEPVETLLAPWKTARFALETALLDAITLRLGQPLANSLTTLPLDVVPSNALLDASKDDLGQRAGELSAQGFTALKVKLRARDDVAFAREVQALRELRQVWPGELRLDPNGMWTVEEARQKLVILAEFRPRYVEQPVPADRLIDLGATACPWAADESLLVPGLAKQLVEKGDCVAFILKPALLGGFSKALELAYLAKREGISAIVTHALDGPVGIAAATEMARAVANEGDACGLDRHVSLSRYPSLTMPHHLRAGYVTRANQPGLGFSEEDRKRWLMMA